MRQQLEGGDGIVRGRGATHHRQQGWRSQWRLTKG